MPEYHLPSTAYRSRTLASPQFHANLDAPACERRLRSCAGLGSKANRYAWMTFTGLVAAWPLGRTPRKAGMEYCPVPEGTCHHPFRE